MKIGNRNLKRLRRYDVAVDALLLLVCTSIGLGGVLRATIADAGSGVGSLGVVQLFAGLPVEAPLEESPSQPEAPVAGSTSTEIAKGEEEAAGSLSSLVRRHRRVGSRECRVDQFYARAIHLLRGNALAQFEHRFRNGCGAPLRC